MSSSKKSSKKFKLINELNKLLHACRAPDNIKPTHVSIAHPAGKYLITSKEDKKQFIKLYSKGVQLGCKLSLCEMQKEYGPVKVDIDLEKPSDDVKKDDRLYTPEMILETVNIYRKSIKTYLDVSHGQIQAFILEKEAPTNKGVTLRDGFHIIFPHINANYKIRHQIRKDSLEQARELGLFDGFTKNVDTIIDGAVVNSSPWLMYGSKKSIGGTYSLTQVLSHDNVNLPLKDFPIKTLIKKFSLQNDNWMKDKYKTNLKDGISEDDFVPKHENKSKYLDIIPSFEQTTEITKAIKLLKILSPERAENYQDWLNVGFSLKSLDNSLLSAWIEFSKQSKKFKPGECEKKWKKMKNDGISIRSLYYWAKRDNLIAFNDIMNTECNNLLDKSINGNTLSIAKAIYICYHDSYICSSFKNKTWWEYKDHKWSISQGGIGLMKKIGEEFVNKYINLASYYQNKAAESTGLEKQNFLEKAQKVNKISQQILNIKFRESLMRECTILFFDAKFEENLDEKYNLVGFNNGVYDLDKEEFREGNPEDYISLSSNISYEEWNPKGSYGIKIMKFLQEIHPNKNIRNYLQTLLSTYVHGDNKEEKLHLFTGCGSNGKSVLCELMSLALGDYYITPPITIFTRKRSSSGQATPELAQIKGKRVGICQEPEGGEKLHVGLMKELTGNDQFYARPLFKDPIMIKPQIKFVLTCNNKPEVGARDRGTWRRIRVVHFGVEFVENPTKPHQAKIDRNLKNCLADWAPQFMGLLIHTYINTYKKKGLKEPKEIRDETKDYEKESDHFSEFFDERLEKVEDNSMTLTRATIWKDFKQWFNDEHKQHKLPLRKEFEEYIKSILGPFVKSKWFGVAFKREDSSSDDDGELDI